MKNINPSVKSLVAALAVVTIVGGIVVSSSAPAGASVRDEIQRNRTERQLGRALRSVLTPDQQAEIEAFRETSQELREARRDFLADQRDLLADFELSPRQWEALEGIVDAHGDGLLEAMMNLVDARIALREAVFAAERDGEAIQIAAENVGITLGDAAALMNGVVVDVRAILTPEQQATLATLRENVSMQRDENRYVVLDRILALREGLDLTDLQKAALADVLRDALGRISLDRVDSF